MLCIKREENSYQACDQRQRRDFTSKAIELTIATHGVDFCDFAFVSNNLLYPSKSKLQKRSNFYYTRGITQKHVTQSCKRAEILGPNSARIRKYKPEPEKRFKPDLDPTEARNLTIFY